MSIVNELSFILSKSINRKTNVLVGVVKNRYSFHSRAGLRIPHCGTENKWKTPHYFTYKAVVKVWNSCGGRVSWSMTCQAENRGLNPGSHPKNFWNFLRHLRVLRWRKISWILHNTILPNTLTVFVKFPIHTYYLRPKYRSFREDTCAQHWDERFKIALLSPTIMTALPESLTDIDVLCINK